MDRILNAMLLGVAVVMAELTAVADYVREDELDVAVIVQQTSVPQQVADLRTTFPVASLSGTALKGLMYSANSWERNAAQDASRTATITAQAGTLANGVFTPDGSAEVTVMSGRKGEGTVDWNATEISKMVYRLTHTVRKGGAVDAAGTFYGYLDFTHRVGCYASQAEVEAVLGEITHRITVVPDADWPWQPIDSAAVRSGIGTDEWLEPDVETTTTFSFFGRGVLNYDYALSGGTLKVLADDEEVSTFVEVTAGWVSRTIAFDGHEAHKVEFAYTADGSGAAAIRNVRWEEPSEGMRMTGAGEAVRVDLQEGEVRTPKKLAHVLPFVYSPTNFTGTVDGTAARVSIVRLEGDDPDVTKWTETGAPRVLKECSDEGEVVWRAEKGVWKATFEIFDGETRKDPPQIKYFDLRNATGYGFALILK